MNLNSTIINVLKVFATLLVFFCHSVIVAGECFAPHGLIHLFSTPAWGGVWIFLIISGLLSSWGFESGRYQLTKSSIKKYYKGRVTKILLPTWIFLTLVIIFNMRESVLKWDVILRMLTCTYNGGDAGVQGVGATWYIFVVMWLYFLTPFFILLLNKYEEKNKNGLFVAFLRLMLLVLALGLCYRIGGYYLHLDVYNWLYANVLACLDLFVAGMICAKMIKVFPVEKLRQLINTRGYLLLLFFLMNAVLIARGKFPFLDFIYRFISPTLYIFFTMALVLFYSVEDKESKLLEGRLSKICNLICPFSFAFYLWHTSLLAAIAEKFSWIANDYYHYFAMLIIGIIVISYVSYLMTRLNDSIIKTINR